MPVRSLHPPPGPPALLATTRILGGGAARFVAGLGDSYFPDLEKLGFAERFSRMRREAPARTRDPPQVPMSHPEVTDLEDIMRFLMGVYEGHIEQRYGMHTGTEAEWRGDGTGRWEGGGGGGAPPAGGGARGA